MKSDEIKAKNGLGVLAAISLSVCGLFTIDGGKAYSSGNLTYLELPLAILVSLAPVCLAAIAVRRAGDKGLPALLRFALGGAFGFFAALPIAAALVFCAAKPLSALVSALHGLVYEEVAYPRLLLFVLPVTAFMAWRGEKGLGRTAIVFSALLILTAAAAVGYSASGFEAYRLEPFPDLGEAAAFTGSQTLYALAPFSALLCFGGRNAPSPKKAVTAGLFAALFCFVMQLALALVYPARVLEGLPLPLARMTFLNISQSYVLRLDKLLIMVWTAGCMLSGAFLISAASRLLAGSGRAQKPVSLLLSSLTGVLILAEQGGIFTRARDFFGFFSRFGSLFALAPLTVCTLAVLVKKRRSA